MADIFQITPNFTEIVPPFRHQENCIPSAAIRWPDECEELEGESVIMEHRAIVTLNPAGRLIWDATENRVTLRYGIQGVLHALVSAELALFSEQ